MHLEAEDFTAINHLPLLNQSLYRLHWQATAQHPPQLYPGKVTLFRAQARPLVHGLSQDLGWSPLAAGGVEVIPVTGHHHTLMTDRYVKPLAKALQTWMDNSDKSYRE